MRFVLESKSLPVYPSRTSQAQFERDRAANAKKRPAKPKSREFEELHPRGAGGKFATANSSENLREGLGGDRVKAVQEQLGALGYDVGEHGEDGKLGPDTKAAIQEFQREHGLDDDGVVGPLTAAAMAAVISARRALGIMGDRDAQEHDDRSAADRRTGGRGRRAKKKKIEPAPGRSPRGGYAVESFEDGSALYEDGLVYDPDTGKFRKPRKDAAVDADVETKVIRSVRTPEGARKYGVPIGTPITRDVLARANRPNRWDGSVQKPTRSGGPRRSSVPSGIRSGWTEEELAASMLPPMKEDGTPTAGELQEARFRARALLGREPTEAEVQRALPQVLRESALRQAPGEEFGYDDRVRLRSGGNFQSGESTAKVVNPRSKDGLVLLNSGDLVRPDQISLVARADGAKPEAPKPTRQMPGATDLRGSGRSPSGRLRNFAQMGDEKLTHTLGQVEAEDDDPEALDALRSEAQRRGLIDPVASDIEVSQPTSVPGDADDEDEDDDMEDVLQPGQFVHVLDDRGDPEFVATVIDGPDEDGDYRLLDENAKPLWRNEDQLEVDEMTDRERLAGASILLDAPGPVDLAALRGALDRANADDDTREDYLARAIAKNAGGTFEGRSEDDDDVDRSGVEIFGTLTSAEAADLRSAVGNAGDVSDDDFDAIFAALRSGDVDDLEPHQRGQLRRALETAAGDSPNLLSLQSAYDDIGGIDPTPAAPDADLPPAADDQPPVLNVLDPDTIKTIRKRKAAVKFYAKKDGKDEAEAARLAARFEAIATNAAHHRKPVPSIKQGREDKYPADLTGDVPASDVPEAPPGPKVAVSIPGHVIADWQSREVGNDPRDSPVYKRIRAMDRAGKIELTRGELEALRSDAAYYGEADGPGEFLSPSERRAYRLAAERANAALKELDALEAAADEAMTEQDYHDLLSRAASYHNPFPKNTQRASDFEGHLDNMSQRIADGEDPMSVLEGADLDSVVAQAKRYVDEENPPEAADTPTDPTPTKQQRLPSLSHDQRAIIEDVVKAVGDDAGFGNVAKSFAEVNDRDAAIAAVTEHMNEHLANLAASGKTVASPAHRSVLRKLGKLDAPSATADAPSATASVPETVPTPPGAPEVFTAPFGARLGATRRRTSVTSDDLGSYVSVGDDKVRIADLSYSEPPRPIGPDGEEIPATNGGWMITPLELDAASIMNLEGLPDAPWGGGKELPMDHPAQIMRMRLANRTHDEVIVRNGFKSRGGMNNISVTGDGTIRLSENATIGYDDDAFAVVEYELFPDGTFRRRQVGAGSDFFDDADAPPSGESAYLGDAKAAARALDNWWVNELGKLGFSFRTAPKA